MVADMTKHFCDECGKETTKDNKRRAFTMRITWCEDDDARQLQGEFCDAECARKCMTRNFFPEEAGTTSAEASTGHAAIDAA